MDKNEFELIGRVTQIPELHQSPKGVEYTRITVATNKPVRNANGTWSEKTVFNTVAFFGDQAKRCIQYLAKGQLVRVTGAVETTTVEKDGSKQSLVSLRASGIKFGPKAKTSHNQATYEGDPQAIPVPQATPIPPQNTQQTPQYVQQPPQHYVHQPPQQPTQPPQQYPPSTHHPDDIHF